MARKTRDKKDRTSIVISAVVHGALIGVIMFWLTTTESGREFGRKILEAVRSEKKTEKATEKPKQTTQKDPPKQLPKINEGAEPKSGGGTRRAVASDAPAAAGESFFADTREQVKGAGREGGAGREKTETKPVMAPPRRTGAPAKPLFQSAAPKSDIKQLLAQRARDAAATESFGSEQIAKTGVSDAGAIIKNVSGATVVDGKFAVIRGLNDRYVTTTLNGGEVPSADPYRRSVSLDLFPAQVIDKVVVAKTFTPDQPGTYTGGGIDIVTKSFPERGFANMSLGASYNTQATGNPNFLSYSGGGLDWAGMDDGTRAIPGALSGRGLVVPPPPPNTGRPSNPQYQQRLDDANLIADLTREMGTTQFAPHREAPGPNHNFAAAAGETAHLLGRPLGVFLGVNYRRDFQFYEDAIRRSYVPGSAPGEFVVRTDYEDTRAVDTVNWAGMVNLGYQPFEGHEVGFNFLYNQNGEDLARQQVGTSTDDIGSIYHQNRLHFTERNLRTYQLKGRHELPAAGNIRFDWLASLAQTTQEEPDVRFFNYVENGGNFETGTGNVPDPKNPTRYFRNLDENNRNLKLDLTVPFRHWREQEGIFKTGVYDSQSKRTFIDREVFYQGNEPFNGDPNAYLNPATFGYTATTNNLRNIIFDWRRYVQTRDSAYEGEFKVRAAYVMLDAPLITLDRPLSLFGVPFFEGLRLVGGVRNESTDLSIDSRSYLANSITGQSTNSSRLEQTDLLPAAGLIWSVRTNMNIRVSYSQTIARPSFRELAGYRSYDPVLDVLLDGNPALKMSAIENWDIRWEWFPRPGEFFSVSLFTKDLKDAIERRFVTTDGEIVSFANRETAKVYGIEFEARRSLDFIHRDLSLFSLGGNLSLIGSETPLTREEIVAKESVFGPGNFDKERTLYDQSPYILNLDLTYDNPRIGTTASLLYNTAGPRVSIASLNTEDIYEQPAPTLDILLAQKLGRSLGVRFTARNLLNPRIERTYGKSGDLLFSSYRRGLTFGLSLSYEF